MSTTYSVTVNNYNGYQSQCHDAGRSVNRAATIAKKLAKELAGNDDAIIYVEFFRSNDGQHGYVNPGKNHSVTGKSWM